MSSRSAEIQATPESFNEMPLPGLTPPVIIAYFLFQLLYFLSEVAIASSLYRFRRRIPPIRNSRYRSAIWRGFFIAWSSALLFLLIFDCHLVAYIRDKSNLNIRCDHAKAVELCLAAVETLVVVAVALIPISWLANKLINPRRKSLLVIACVIFCFNIGGATFSRALILTKDKPYESQWIACHLTNWVLVWANIRRVCYNIRDMRPLLREIFPASIRARFPRLGLEEQKLHPPSTVDDTSLLSASVAMGEVSTTNLAPKENS